MPEFGKLAALAEADGQAITDNARIGPNGLGCCRSAQVSSKSPAAARPYLRLLKQSHVFRG